MMKSTPAGKPYETAQGDFPQPSDQATELAQRFHEAYERLAPLFGYETREASAKPWEDVPENNRRLMTAVCREILGEKLTPPEQHEPPLPRASFDYDRSIHSNPDAKAWAEFFNASLVQRGEQPLDPDLMVGWFANAMMAMHDHMAGRHHDELREARHLLRIAKDDIDAQRRQSERLRAQLQGMTSLITSLVRSGGINGCSDPEANTPSATYMIERYLADEPNERLSQIRKSSVRATGGSPL